MCSTDLLLNSKIDLFITEFWVVDEYGRADAVYTLDQFMELDEINAYKDKIYYVTADDGTQIPMGIITNNRTYNENPEIIAISEYSMNKEKAESFIRYVLKEEMN